MSAWPLMFSSASLARTIKNCMWSMQGRSSLLDAVVRTDLVKITNDVRRPKRMKKKRRKRITAGVEEKDKAIGRTLRRSQCRSGHSPSNAADGDQTAGLVAVEESRLDRSFHHESWIRVLVAMCSQSTLILARSLTCCQWSFRRRSCRRGPCHCSPGWSGRRRCHVP